MVIVVVVQVTCVKVAVDVTSSVVGARPRQSQAASMVAQAKPVRTAVGATSQDGLGAGVGVTIGAVVRITEEAEIDPVGSTVELLETIGCGILEDPVDKGMEEPVTAPVAAPVW